MMQTLIKKVSGDSNELSRRLTEALEIDDPKHVTVNPRTRHIHVKVLLIIVLCILNDSLLISLIRL